MLIALGFKLVELELGLGVKEKSLIVTDDSSEEAE